MLPFNKSFLRDDNIITCLPEEVPVYPKGVGVAVFEAMKKHGDKLLAQIDTETGEKDSYPQYLQRCVRTALWLKTQNIKQNDIICVYSHNHKNSSVPFIATLLVGATATGLDPNLSVREITHLLNEIKSNLKIIFVSEESVDILKQCVDFDVKIVVFEHSEFETCLKEQSDEDQFEPTPVSNINDTCMIFFSSGSTGLPKAVCLHHYAALSSTFHNSVNPEDLNMPQLLLDQSRLSGPTSVIVYSTLYWCSAGISTVICCLNGVCRLLAKSFDAEKFWCILDQYKLNLAALLPVQAMAICKAKRREYLDTSSLLRLTIMGAPISKAQITFIRESFPQCVVSQVYGQTEATTITSFNPLNRHHKKFIDEKPTSCGLPIPGCSYKIVDILSGKTLEPGQKGELWIKSKTLLNGYLNFNSPIIDKNGWFKSGDILYYDEDLCFFYVDRLNEMLKYNGHVISPAYIEYELLKEPAVKEAVVIGIPFEEDGDHLMGVVLLNEDLQVSPEDLEKRIEETMPDSFKLRAGVKILNDLPRTVTGKVNRMKLKTMFIS